MRELNDPKREELLAVLRKIELQATRHRRANDSLEYLLRDIEIIAQIASEEASERLAGGSVASSRGSVP